MSDINTTLKRFENVSVLVFGDVMLDRYLMGRVERVSPEAPVPVVELEVEKLVLGGAANVAANVAGLGARTTLVSVTGHDGEASQIKELLENAGIGSESVIPSASRITTVKSRIMAGGHQVARVDSERADSLAGDDLEKMTAIFTKLIEGHDVIVISDYGKGVVSAEASTRLITAANSVGVPVFVDPKGLDYRKYDGASVLTPNRKEALELYLAEARRSGTIEEAGRHILKSFEIEELVITLGPDGMALFEKGREMESLAASARIVFDVTGAGDTVIAALAVARAAGADLGSAAIIANAAAGEVVDKTGTFAVRKKDVVRALGRIEKGETKAV